MRYLDRLVIVWYWGALLIDSFPSFQSTFSDFLNIVLRTFCLRVLRWLVNVSVLSLAYFIVNELKASWLSLEDLG